MAAAQPIGWFLFADSYLACAEALRRSPPADLRFDAPVRYLLFHAMELYLKAFLRLKGISSTTPGSIPIMRSSKCRKRPGTWCRT